MGLFIVFLCLTRAKSIILLRQANDIFWFGRCSFKTINKLAN